MKLFRRFLVLCAVCIILFTTWYYVWLSPRYVVPILTYHRFGYESSTLYVTPENFQRQMHYLKEKRYTVISLDELVEGIQKKRHFSHNTVVITMDDGNEDNYRYAYPVLKKYQFPATIFLIANAIENKTDFLTLNQIEEMKKNAISFGAHTANHVYVPSIAAPDILRSEIEGAKKIIFLKTGIDPQYFCYPVGGFNRISKEMVRQAGYKGACTTNRGRSFYNEDVFALKRVKITNGDMNKPLSFRAKLSGYYNLFKRPKSEE